jgi:hemerythrin-like domain-containing protein
VAFSSATGMTRRRRSVFRLGPGRASSLVGTVYVAFMGHMASEPDDLVSVLTREHQEQRLLFTELENLDPGEKLQRMLTCQLVTEMVRHAVAEESYLYPVCRDCLPPGDPDLAAGLSQHDELERLLGRLEDPGLSDDRFAALLTRVITEGRRHFDEEERQLFPELASCVGPDELVALGRAAMASRARMTEPVGDGPPLLEQLMQTGSGLVARIRERLCGDDRPYPLR